MGFFAGSLDSADVTPVADFSTPPAAGAPKGTVSGTVIDVNTHAPVAGVRVGFAGLDSPFPGGAGATTSATGAYTMPAAFAHLYPYLTSSGAGYEPVIVKPFNLVAGAQGRNFQNRRGWALSSGGGRIAAFTGRTSPPSAAARPVRSTARRAAAGAASPTTPSPSGSRPGST